MSRCEAEPALTSRVGPLCINARSVAQALEHDGNRDASGTEVSQGAQERAVVRGDASERPARVLLRHRSVPCQSHSLTKPRDQLE